MRGWGQYGTQLAYLATVVTLLFGVISLVNPFFMARVLGLTFTEPRGVSELRATYGALFTVMGAVMLWALLTRHRSAGWLRFAGLLWLGAAGGRLVSMVVDGVPTLYNFLVLALELLIGLGALSGSFAGRKVARKQEPSEPR